MIYLYNWILVSCNAILGLSQSVMYLSYKQEVKLAIKQGLLELPFFSSKNLKTYNVCAR